MAVAALGAACLWIALLYQAARVFPRFDPFEDRCPTCGKLALQEYKVHTNPPALWAMYDCLKCNGEFVKEEGRTIPRKDYTGPLIVEFFFLVRENPDADQDSLLRQLQADWQKNKVGKGQ